MKVKTAELEGAALDWAVAKCEGLLCFGYRTDGERLSIQNSDREVGAFTPSTNWAEAGPIIERIVTKLEDYGDAWGAEGPDAPEQYGPTFLVAAMRCYVASRLGDEVDVPDELVAQVNRPADASEDQVADERQRSRA